MFLLLWAFLCLKFGLAAAAVEHRPREIETGPNGNIRINLGGIPDPRSFPHVPKFGHLRLKTSGNPTVSDPNPLTPLNSVSTLSPSDSRALPYIDVDTTDEDYDYQSFSKTDQSTPTSPTPKVRKPKRAKSKRVSLVQFIKELIEPPQGTPSRSTISSQLAQSKAFGTSSAHQYGRRGLKPLSQPNKWVDADAYVRPRASNHYARLETVFDSSPERQSVNSGCRTWAEFDKFTEAASSRQPNQIGIYEQAPVLSNRFAKSSSPNSRSTSAVFSPRSKRRGQHTNDSELPLPECYRNQHFVCCNRVLEELIYRTDDWMITANVNKCNTQIFTQLLKNNAEKQFQTTFEVVVAHGDFAAKIRFKDNLVCKTITNAKVVLIYGTSESYDMESYNRRDPLST